MAYQLRDVNCDGRRDGGFVSTQHPAHFLAVDPLFPDTDLASLGQNCIPGSHKASKRLPGKLSAVTSAGTSRPDGLFIDPQELWDSRHLVVPEMRAGDL